MVQAAHNLLPDAVDTYIGNLTEGKNYEEENEKNPKSLSKIAQVTKVSRIQNKEIKDFIYKTYERISPDDVLVVLNDKSEAAQKLKKSKGVKDVISRNWDKIQSNYYVNKDLGVNFYNYSSFIKKIGPSDNMKAAYGLASLWSPHIDKNNNLVMYFIDYMDYSKSKSKTGYLNAINDDAYILQEQGFIKPYLKVIKIVFTPQEYKNLHR